MRVKFYLYRPGKKLIKQSNAPLDLRAFNERAATKTAGIFAWVSYNSHRVRITTGESINPKFWNTKQHEASRNSFPEFGEFNTLLKHISLLISKTYLQYKIDNDGQEPDPTLLKNLVENKLGRASSRQLSFVEFFKEFVFRQKEGLRVGSKGKVLNPVTAKHYQHTLNTILKFKASINFRDIDLSFYNEYLQFLNNEGISLNTAGSHIKRLKVVLNEAEANGLPVNHDFKSKYFARMAEEAENIALTQNELDTLQTIDLSGSARLDAVRDLFVIGCNTGLRYSDFSSLKPTDIHGNMIRITQQKTGGKIVIPVHPVVQKILDKYGGNLPKSISNQKTNDYLKEIGQQVKDLRNKETKSTTKGGKKVTEVFERWQMLSTHTARRTFATLQYHKGVPSLTIMGITGHKTEKDFLRYIKVSPDEHAKKIREIWDKEAKEEEQTVIKE